MRYFPTYLWCKERSPFVLKSIRSLHNMIPSTNHDLEIIHLASNTHDTLLYFPLLRNSSFVSSCLTRKHALGIWRMFHSIVATNSLFAPFHLVTFDVRIPHEWGVSMWYWMLPSVVRNVAARTDKEDDMCSSSIVWSCAWTFTFIRDGTNQYVMDLLGIKWVFQLIMVRPVQAGPSSFGENQKPFQKDRIQIHCKQSKKHTHMQFPETPLTIRNADSNSKSYLK